MDLFSLLKCFCYRVVCSFRIFLQMRLRPLIDFHSPFTERYFNVLASDESESINLNPYIFGPISVEKQRNGYISVIDLMLRLAFTFAKALAKLVRNDNSWRYIVQTLTYNSHSCRSNFEPISFMNCLTILL